MAHHHQHKPPPTETVETQRGSKTLAGMDGASAPPEGPFPLGPFPRQIWIHDNTPQDSLDEACHEIWKRVQMLLAELQPPASGLYSDQPGILPRGTTTFQSHNYWLDEPEGLEDIYRAMIGNKEREMKLRALCDYQLSAKSVVSNFLPSTKSHKNSSGLEDGSMTGTHSMEGSELEVSFPLKHTATAGGPGDQVMAEETKVVKEFTQNSIFSCTKNSTAASTAAVESQVAGQKQQFPMFAEICSKIDANTVTKNPVTTTATSDQKNTKYYPSTPGFSTTSVTTAAHQPVRQNMIFPPFSTFPKHSNFPQYQGPFLLRARIPYQPALHPPFGHYSRQAAPYNPQLFFQPPYPQVPNYIPLVQPGYLHQQIVPPALPGNICNPARMGSAIQFLPPCGFSSAPGGAAMTNSNYFYSESCVKF